MWSHGMDCMHQRMYHNTSPSATSNFELKIAEKRSRWGDDQQPQQHESGCNTGSSALTVVHRAALHHYCWIDPRGLLLWMWGLILSLGRITSRLNTYPCAPACSGSLLPHVFKALSFREHICGLCCVANTACCKCVQHSERHAGNVLQNHWPSTQRWEHLCLIKCHMSDAAKGLIMRINHTGNMVEPGLQCWFGQRRFFLFFSTITCVSVAAESYLCHLVSRCSDLWPQTSPHARTGWRVGGVTCRTSHPTLWEFTALKYRRSSNVQLETKSEK